MYEARQNKEKVSRRIDGGGAARQIGRKKLYLPDNNIIRNTKVKQKYGEYDAVRSTFHSKRKSNWQGMHRGNDKTTYDINQIYTKRVLKLRRELNSMFVTRYNAESDFVKLAIQAEIAKALEAGNCGDYAAIVATRLYRKTFNQYIYRCSIYNHDHAFVMTSLVPLNLESVDNENDNFILSHKIRYRLSDSNDGNNIIVVDAWGGNAICTLSQYYGNNPYSGLEIRNRDICISYYSISGENKLLTREQKDEIWTIVQQKIDETNWNEIKVYEPRNVITNIGHEILDARDPIERLKEATDYEEINQILQQNQGIDVFVFEHLDDLFSNLRYIAKEYLCYLNKDLIFDRLAQYNMNDAFQLLNDYFPEPMMIYYYTKLDEEKKKEFEKKFCELYGPYAHIDSYVEYYDYFIN